MFRTTAGAHVKAMRCESGPQGRGAQAPDIAGFSRSFQPVHHEDLAARLAVRALRAHQHLHIRLGAIQPPFDGKLRVPVRPLPEVAGEGLQVRTAQERFKRSHGVINL